jgi:hypothetical protein
MLDQGITYNTTMAMVAGAVMLFILVFLRVVQQPARKTIHGWAWMFAALGLFLAVTGTHMTLTWPLKQIPVPASLAARPTTSPSVSPPCSLAFWCSSGP